MSPSQLKNLRIGDYAYMPGIKQGTPNHEGVITKITHADRGPAMITIRILNSDGSLRWRKRAFTSVKLSPPSSACSASSVVNSPF